MTAHHFYHLHYGHGHVSSRWEPVAEEHFARLKEAHFDGEVHVGLVGDPDRRESVAKKLTALWPRWCLTAEADEGYEQSTIDAMHKFAKRALPETPVLYTHTKGAYQDTSFNRAWRRSMEGLLIGSGSMTFWYACVKALERYDVIGSHWLTHDEFPETVTNGKPMFGGNMWWATAGYLAKLPPVEGGNPNMGYNRYKAEEWVGSGNPKVLDLKPGWPEYPMDDGEYDSVTGGRLHA